MADSPSGIMVQSTLDEAETSRNEKPETWPGTAYCAQPARIGEQKRRLTRLNRASKAAELGGKCSKMNHRNSRIKYKQPEGMRV